MKYRLNIIKNGQIINSITVEENSPAIIDVEPGLRFQLFDETGQLVVNPTTETKENDLWVFLNKQDSPDLILSHYTQFDTVDSATALEQFNSTFAVGDDIPMVSDVARDTLLAEEISLETEAVTGSSSLGVGGALLGLLGAAGVAAAASSGGGNSGGNVGGGGTDTEKLEISNQNHNYQENQKIAGKTIATVVVKGNVKVIEYSITDGNADGYFTIDKTTGEISLTHKGLNATANDYDDANKSFTLTVKVKDAANNEASNTVTLNLTDDSSDNKPNSAPTDISLSHNDVFEDADGAVVGLLDTKDVDANDVHSYSLSDSSGKFEIVGGVLKVKDGVSLNYETKSEYTVEVTSTDKENASTSKKLTIKVDNQYEGLNNTTNNNGTNADDDIPYFVNALFMQDLTDHAATVNLWGHNAGEHPYEFDNIEKFIGKERTVYYGFGDKDNDEHRPFGTTYLNTGRNFTDAQKAGVHKAMKAYADQF